MTRCITHVCRTCEQEAGIRIRGAKHRDCDYHYLEAVVRNPLCLPTWRQKAQYRFWRIIRGDDDIFGVLVIGGVVLLLILNILKVMGHD